MSAGMASARVAVGRILSLLVLSMTLAACGGGGSADSAGTTTSTTSPVAPPVSAPPVSAPPATATPPSTTTTSTAQTLQASSPSISVQKSVTELSASATIQVFIANQTTSVYVGGSYSKNGISSAQLVDGPTALSMEVTFKIPYQTAPGTYTDVISLRACLESPCVNHIAGSPLSIPVTYTVVTGASGPTLSLQKNNISIDRFLMNAMNPGTQTVGVTFSGTGGLQPIVTVSNTSNTIVQATYGFGGINISVKNAAQLGVGTFSDTVTVNACLDSQCVNQLAGSPATINLQYTIRNSELGTGYRLRGVLGKANNMAWDAVRQVMYVAMAPDDPDHPNSIGVLDPVSGTMLSYTATGSDPRYLELSPDGQYLYVSLRGAGEIRRLNLPSMTLDLTIPVGTKNPGGTQLYALEVRASPDSPHILGVIRGDSSNNAWDLVIFDDAVMRPQGLGRLIAADRVSSFRWDTGSQIFGFNAGTALRIGMNGAGPQISASQLVTSTSTGAVYLQSGRMYTQIGGLVYDPLTFTAIGTFPVGQNFMVPAVDPARAFFATGQTIQSFDVNTFAPIASIPVSDASLSTNTRMIRWGYDGLALVKYLPSVFGTQGILLIDGAFVRQ